MRRVDVGRLLLSAWQEVILQRRHCRTKDWPYSQADDLQTVRILFRFGVLQFPACVMWEVVVLVLRGRGRVGLLGMNADCLRVDMFVPECS